MSIFTKKPNYWIEYINKQGTKIANVGERVSDRLTFMGINDETLQHIREAYSLIAPHKDEIVNEFYEKITSVELLNEIISEYSTVERLRQTMAIYLEQFLQADVNEEYVQTRIVVGEVHSRISLTAEHFISAHHLLIQAMTTIVMEQLYSQPNRMIETVLAIQKLAAFDQQLIVEVYMADTFKTFLFGISNTLNDVSELETSKQLMDAMDNMNDESHSVSSATEEVSASILEVATHASKVAEGTDDAVSSAEESKQVVNDTLHDIQQVGEVYNQVVAQVSKLNGEIDKTYEVVEMIRQITDQTNLLALNASIEAARAGDHGKGFAVVANEVRKLAEHTKEQTLHITDNMESLQHVSKLVTEQMHDTEKLIEKSVSGAAIADEALDKIVHAMQEINESTSQIAAMSEEQTSAVDEIAQRNTVISELSNSSHEVATKTAEVIFELSKQLEQYRNTYFETNIQLSDKDIIKIAKTDHLLWKWKVYNVLLGLETLNHEEVASYESCRFGKWYYSQLPEEITRQAAYEQLEQPHKDVHEYAKKAVKLYEEGHIVHAQQAFEHLQKASQEVLELLTQLE